MRPAENHEADGGWCRAGDAVLVPGETVAAAEDDGVVGGVHGGGYMRDFCGAGVDGGRGVVGGEAEGGEDFVLRGVGEKKEAVGHAAAEGDAAVAGGPAAG